LATTAFRTLVTIWAALHELELQTREAVYEQLGDATARFITAERVANTVGTANGAAVTVLPHQLQMRSLVVATKPFIPQRRSISSREVLRRGSYRKHKSKGPPAPTQWDDEHTR